MSADPSLENILLAYRRDELTLSGAVELIEKAFGKRGWSNGPYMPPGGPPKEAFAPYVERLTEDLKKFTK